MALVIANNGKDEILSRLISGGLTLRLYSNDFTPPANGAFTEGEMTEVTAAGYSFAALSDDPVNWTFSAGTGTARRAAAPLESFEMTEEVTVYGYFVTTTGGDIVYAERFSTPHTIGSEGGTSNVTPRIEVNTAA